MDIICLFFGHHKVKNIDQNAGIDTALSYCTECHKVFGLPKMQNPPPPPEKKAAIVITAAEATKISETAYPAEKKQKDYEDNVERYFNEVMGQIQNYAVRGETYAPIMWLKQSMTDRAVKDKLIQLGYEISADESAVMWN